MELLANIFGNIKAQRFRVAIVPDVLLAVLAG